MEGRFFKNLKIFSIFPFWPDKEKGINYCLGISNFSTRKGMSLDINLISSPGSRSIIRENAISCITAYSTMNIFRKEGDSSIIKKNEMSSGVIYDFQVIF